MKIIVCGGRDFDDKDFVFAVLDHINRHRPITDVVHGAAPGADMLAYEWALKRRVRHIPYPAEWKRYGKSAGPVRNQRMLAEEHLGRVNPIQMVIAFPGGTGTADMIRRAKAAGLDPLQPSRSDRYWTSVYETLETNKKDRPKE